MIRVAIIMKMLMVIDYTNDKQENNYNYKNINS